jgi:hypothetical protein
MRGLDPRIQTAVQVALDGRVKLGHEGKIEGGALDLQPILFRKVGEFFRRARADV